MYVSTYLFFKMGYEVTKNGTVKKRDVFPMTF